MSETTRRHIARVRHGSGEGTRDNQLWILRQTPPSAFLCAGIASPGSAVCGTDLAQCEVGRR
jgi:hypothetical protein